LQEVERHHLGEEGRILALKEAAKEVVEAGLEPHTSLQIAERVEAAIVSYNTVCAQLLGKFCKVKKKLPGGLFMWSFL